MKWFGEVDVKVINFDGMTEVDTTVGKLRLLGEVDARLNICDGLGEVEV